MQKFDFFVTVDFWSPVDFLLTFLLNFLNEWERDFFLGQIRVW
jgi:hypothetical protein